MSFNYIAGVSYAPKDNNDSSSATMSYEIENKTLSVKDRAENYIVYKIAGGVHQYWLSTLSFLGIIGNSLSFAIMIQVYSIKVAVP